MPSKVYALPGRFIPGVPANDTEFESQAEADRFLKGETGGVRHDSAFTATKAKAEATIQPDDGDK